MSSTTDTPALKTRSPWATETRKLTKSPKRFNVEPAESTHQNASSEVVLVTGGAGFLGQHIVKHLLEQREIPIQEVRVFNRQPLKWSHGLDGTDVSVPLQQYQGDICNTDDLLKACEGATIVIHNASLIDTFTNPDMDKIHRVNVQGTKNIIQTCLAKNVKYILYTSSVNAKDKVGAYGITKRQAEDLVLEANGRQLPNGQRLRTCALRPIAMFGEGDVSLVLNGLRNIRGGTFTRVGDDEAQFQVAYAGNVAWAFVKAIRRLRETDQSGGSAGGSGKVVEHLIDPAGHAVTIADDTPITSYNRFMEYFVVQNGGKMTNYYLPFWMLHVLASLCEWLSYLLRPVYTLRSPLSKMAITSMQGFQIVDGHEAKRYLGYKPLYSADEVRPGCLRYYKYEYGVKGQTNSD